MDNLAAIITAISGAIVAIVGAIVLLMKVAAPNSRAVHSLRSLWTWLEGQQLTEAVPARLRTAVEKIIDEDDHDDK